MINLSRGGAFLSSEALYMALIDYPRSSVLIQSLVSEIERLSEQQNALRQKAAFIGLTAEEKRQSGERAAKIANLVKLLNEVSQTRGHSRGRRYEQEAQEAARYG